MPRRFPLRSVVVSAAAHLGVGYLLVAYSSFLATHPNQKPPDLNTARILELNINDLAPYIPRPQIQAPKPVPVHAPPRPAPKPQVPQLTAPAIRTPAVNPLPAAGEVRQYIPPPVQVSDAPKVARAPETLIQLDVPKPELQTQLQVPDAVVLTNSPRRFLPRPVIRPPDLPNKDLPQVVVAMDLPKIQDAKGDLPVAQLLTDHTALPVRAASRAPVSGTAPAAAEVSTTGNPKSVEAPALVSLPDNPIPAHAAVVVPPAVQVGSRGNDNTQTQKSPASPAGGGGAGTGQNSQAANNVNPRPPEPSAASTTSATSTAAAGAPSPRPGTAPIPAAALPEVAQIHLPHDGNYSVVISEKSALVPGSADFLRGRPVYSVYLQVGLKRAWILQYCLPGEAGPPQRNSMMVVSAKPVPLSAPYAYTMLRPVLQFAGPGYSMIHGMINEKGKFEQLQQVGDPNLKNATELIQVLSGWEFRPATKDGVPVAVEILLCIPSVSS